MVLESANASDIMVRASQLGTAKMLGVVGYAYYSEAPGYQKWTCYTSYIAGCSRKPCQSADVPKPIRLLEML